MSPEPSPPAAAGAGKGIDAFPRKIAPTNVGGSDLAGTPKVVFQVHPELVAVPCRPWSRAVAVLVDGGEAGGERVSSVDNRQWVKQHLVPLPIVFLLSFGRFTSK